MKPGNIKSFSELPEEIKPKYKPVSEQGAFVEQSAIENPEIGHRIALLENEAFGDLTDSIRESKLSIDEIIEGMLDSKSGYDKKRSLEDLLLQNADLQRLKGEPIDDKIAEVSKKSYISLHYSKILENKLIKGVLPGDIEVIGEVLKDEKVYSNSELLSKLADDEQRKQAFAICKKRVKAGCAVIGRMESIDAAIEMLAETRNLADKNSYSDKSELSSAGKRLAEKIYESGDTSSFAGLVESETFEISNFKDFLHTFGGEPEKIAELTKVSDNLDDIYYALKFVADSELLKSLSEEPANFKKLSEEDKKKAAQYAKILSGALETEPEIISMSNLEDDEMDKYAEKKMPKNKFVIGIDNENKYVIAYGSMKRYEYHRNIFENIQRTQVKSGGYLGKDEIDGKLIFTIRQSSGDFGYYSKEVMEKFRSQIEASLKDVANDKEFELVIKESTQY